MNNLGSYLAGLVLLFHANFAISTPTLALKEAQNCGGCHKPGRTQRHFLDRRCTLDCQGCHIDPAGGGPRNQWGYYYTHAELNVVDFFDPIDPLEDQSRFDLHYDGRVIRRKSKDTDRVFPMSSEFTVRLRPFVDYLHLTYTRLTMGRVDDQILFDNSGERHVRDKFAVMVDALPLNTYVRAYRGPPMYGLRRPNHSLWIRERLGLDQFATTEAFEVGTTPNVPFFRYSQMHGDPYAATEDRQQGGSFHGGLRGVTLGWHVNVSGWDTASDKAAIKMQAIGAGANLWSFILYAERNWRTVTTLKNSSAAKNTWESTTLRLHPNSEISEYSLAYAGIPGVIIGAVQEELRDPNQDSRRLNYYADFHPIPYLHFEIWQRFESGTRKLADILGILHLYADF